MIIVGRIKKAYLCELNWLVEILKTSSAGEVQLQDHSYHRTELNWKSSCQFLHGLFVGTNISIKDMKI